MVIRLAALLFAATALAGCSGSGTDQSPAAGEGSRATVSPTTPPTTSLAQLCPQIESGLPETDFGFPNGAKETAQFADFATSLHAWVDEADAETRPVIEKMAAAVDFAVQRDQGDANQNVQATRDMDASVVAAKKACSGAGSPIFD